MRRSFVASHRIESLHHCADDDNDNADANVDDDVANETVKFIRTCRVKNEFVAEVISSGTLNTLFFAYANARTRTRWFEYYMRNADARGFTESL